ncbi:pyridoxal-dependent decarboxylase [Kitasatospora sp. NPDC091207]|uniref:pyridoxal-dependent decarboxylase n=1 Tax=Kitasatospora sp. NPDC091207 TaxID=3364083 RepID=UPI00382C54FC
MDSAFQAGMGRRVGMWHHADGDWGGLGAAVPALAPLHQGVDELDSTTVDPHQTLSVPVERGALLVPDPEHLPTACAHQACYLTAGEPGVLPWLSHATIELTRPGARALTLWATRSTWAATASPTSSSTTCASPICCATGSRANRDWNCWRAARGRSPAFASPTRSAVTWTLFKPGWPAGSRRTDAPTAPPSPCAAVPCYAPACATTAAPPPTSTC